MRTRRLPHEPPIQRRRERGEGRGEVRRRRSSQRGRLHVARKLGRSRDGDRGPLERCGETRGRHQRHHRRRAERIRGVAVKEKKYKWRREDYQENTRGLLMVHTGNGKGKT